MRCSRCGNENAGQNRFCGMCGASLLAGPVPAPSAQAQPVSVSTSAGAAPEVSHPRTEPRSEAEKPTRVQAPAHDRPTISGPSFLGLNDPSPSHSGTRKRARLSIDPHSAPGSNLEYLLSDEEPPRHWGPGKILFVLIALALAVGFGYLRFKTHGFAWLNPPAKKAEAVAQNVPSDDTQQPAPSGITPEQQPAQTQPTSNPPQPSADGATANTNPPTTVPSASAAPTTPTPNPSSPVDATNTGDAPSPSAGGNNSPDNVHASPKEPAAAPAPSRKAAAPKSTPKPSIPKPSPVTKPAPAADPVVEAQKYLYGKGAAQDCDRGMRLLKPAANQSNPKAMVEMGALYSAGLCTPRDLPTAYRWFALALRRDPESTTIQGDLSKLWGEMTPPERQLAIKLTQ